VANGFRAGIRRFEDKLQKSKVPESPNPDMFNASVSLLQIAQVEKLHDQITLTETVQSELLRPQVI
jgi:hypothetical protein